MECLRDWTAKFRRTVKKLLVLSLAGIFASGCTTLHPVPTDPKVIMVDVKQGDTVRVITKNNKELEFEVKEINDKQIIGEKETVAFTDISQIERREVSSGKTTLLVAGVVVGVVVVLISIVAASIKWGGAGIDLR